MSSSNKPVVSRDAYQQKRPAVLGLVARLAKFVAWLIGPAAEKPNIHPDYQTNTLKRRVLSLVYLGLQIIDRAGLWIRAEHADDAFNTV